MKNQGKRLHMIRQLLWKIAYPPERPHYASWEFYLGKQNGKRLTNSDRRL